jgi:nucleoside-diphosphate-sugar epimerase
MNILITGGLGAVGRPLVQRLLCNGHTIKVIDRIPEAEADQTALGGAAYACCDINDFSAFRQQVRGMQAIVHLAALPHPAAGPGPEVFRINCAGTFNVYEAAAQEGIRRVVSASSINAIGFNYGIKSFPIRYLPVDEDHPSFTTDPYSFSKQVLEEIGAYYWRREGISGVQLRLPAVLHITEEFRAMVSQFAPITRQAFDKVQAISAAGQQQRARQLIAEVDAGRARRDREKPWSGEMPVGEWKPDFNDPLPMIFYGYTDFWAVIHEEDSAQALEKGLIAGYSGSHPLFVADSVNMLNLDAETLARIFYPEAARKRPLVGCEPLVSFDKAHQLIGFEPDHSGAEWLD